MDLGEIGAGALYGAIGGGLGALLGALLATPFRNRTVSTVLTVIFVVIGVNAARPLLSPYMGKYIGDDSNATLVQAAVISDREVDRIMEGLRADPLVDAILDREPVLVDEAREKLSRAYASGGLAALNKAAAEFGYAIGQSQMLGYYVRATDNDLLQAVNLMTDNIEYLVDAGPEVCYAWLFGAFGYVQLDFAALVRALGDERYKAQQTAMGMLVRNAADVAPEYDREQAFEIVRKAGREMLSVLGPDMMDLINGRLMPASVEDKRLACKALGVMNRTMLDSDNPPAALRYTFEMAIPE